MPNRRRHRCLSRPWQAASGLVVAVLFTLAGGGGCVLVPCGPYTCADSICTCLPAGPLFAVREAAALAGPPPVAMSSRPAAHAADVQACVAPEVMGY